ncbi:hypothetical protein BRC68_15290 [Halobacteriales archaeon QH_6_64_20]|nr:MAG: hypothetical protein BRC68_15290 [Halobacteriales archaeon QH_6_64_20]
MSVTMGTFEYAKLAISKYRREGLRPTLWATAAVLKGVLAGLSFVVADRIYDYEKTRICVAMRGTLPESDTFALINQVDDIEDITRLCIGFPRGLDEEHVDETSIEAADTEIEFVETHSLEFVRNALESRLVLLKQDGQLGWYQLFDSDGTDFVRLYHGPITKAYGRTRSSSQAERGLVSIGARIDTPHTTRSVGSDVERHFRAASEDVHPKRFAEYGYPRFDRIENLRSSAVEPIVPEETRSLLESDSDSTHVLYATTHKDGAYDTTFFPFPSFDPSVLRRHLKENDIRLFLRLHPMYEDRHMEFVDGETVFFAGQAFSNSATEMMPFFDGLITDYSSIYVEFLPFDRPIVFVKDDHERFREIRGFGFDYETYFPGPKVDSFGAFLDRLETIAESGTDGFGAEREFVRRSLVPHREGTFVERALSGVGGSEGERPLVTGDEQAVASIDRNTHSSASKDP